MLIALISDVHGNLPALEAVLKDIRSTEAEEIWFLGDLIGYIPFPNECIELIGKITSKSIIGNYDQKVINFNLKKGEWKKSKKAAKFDSFAWNNEHVNSKGKKYLKSLPLDVRLKIHKFDILLTHGSPAEINEPVFPDTPREHLIELGKIAQADVIIMGHSHQFMKVKIGNKWFINPGSVGMPNKKDIRACYALMEISENKINVTERKIEYETAGIAEKFKEAEFPDKLIKMIEDEYRIIQNKKEDPCESKKTTDLELVINLAEKCRYEKQHSEQVTCLALNLFDELKFLHKLSDKSRFILQCAGILHDIGWLKGQKGHHKTAMKLILDSKKLSFNQKERNMIALIARYHRKALPKDSHAVFSKLSDQEKHKVNILAGILRIADGLDRTHTNAVKSVRCEISDKRLVMKCEADASSVFEMQAAVKKSDLLRKVLEKEIKFIM